MEYQVTAHTHLREVDDGAIAINLDSGNYYALNEMGVLMWNLLQEKDSLAAVVEAIAVDYDVTHEQVVADLHAFLADLEDNGLIEHT